jgi:hypothetical protein
MENKTERQYLVFTKKALSSEQPRNVYVEDGHTSKEGYTRFRNLKTGTKKNFFSDMEKMESIDGRGYTRNPKFINAVIQENIDFLENQIETLQEELQET